MDQTDVECAGSVGAVSEAALADDGYKPAPEWPDAVKKRPPSYEQHAIELYNLDHDWRAYSWQANGDRQSGFIELKGGVYRHVKTRGKYKGETDFRKPEPGTEITATIPMRIHRDWIARWESQTGFCAECNGTGERNTGWDHIKGLRFEPCKKCGATGLQRSGDRHNTRTPATGA